MPGSSSVSIQISAVVPMILNLSLDFSAGSSARIQGYLPGAGEVPTSGGASDATRFLIRENATIELGDARLFSNSRGYYSIDVYSANRGALRAETGSAAIPYTLRLGSEAAGRKDGVFSFRGSGKTGGEGTSLKVALAIPSIPKTASAGLYSDQLLFSVAAD